eukprot:Tbor_TRINITY_DN2369_c0_g1::TRINITY_DN2369_c0_g1_i1::g.113::m.113/K12272/SRPRB, SRP102; signal recognition particle receptor subunit beta
MIPITSDSVFELFNSYISGAMIAAVIIVVYFIFRNGLWSADSCRAVASFVGANIPRTNVVLLGLPGAGKTCLFLKLCSSKDNGFCNTQTSMIANRAFLVGIDHCVTKQTVVDCPGHPRLNHLVIDEVLAAKKVVVVIDSITVLDDGNEGIKALVPLLVDVLQSHAFYGVSDILFACTKRDEATSFTSKAIRGQLEAEISIALSTRAVGIGSLTGEVKKNVRTKSHARPKDECMLYLDERQKFRFDSLATKVQFIDCSVDDWSKVSAFCE